MTSRHLSFALLASVALTLIACGGGGGGGGGTGGGGGGGVLPTIAPTAAPTATPIAAIGDVRSLGNLVSYRVCYDDDDASLIEMAPSLSGVLINVTGSAQFRSPSSDGSPIVGCVYNRTDHALYYATGAAIYRATNNGSGTTVLTNPSAAGGLAADASGTVYYVNANGDIDAIRNGLKQTLAAGAVVSFVNGIVPAMTFDPDDGALYVTDPFGTMVKRVTTTGVVTTLAGHCTNSLYGCIGANVPGVGAAAAFGSPAGIAYAGNGVLYMSDATNCVLWSISTTTGNATVVAGYGANAVGDGNGLRAFLSLPADLAFVRASGTLYFTEASGIFSNPVVSVFATSGLAQPAFMPPTLRFAIPTVNTQPEYGAVASDGSFWFPLPGANAVAHVTANGALTQYPLTTGYRGPMFIAIDGGGTVWVSCQYYANSFPTSAGLMAIVPGGAMTYYMAIQEGNTSPGAVEDLTIGPDGRPWFTETDGTGSTIQSVTGSGSVISYTIAPSGIPVPPATPAPHARAIVAGPDGNLWYSANSIIGRITTSGTILPAFPLANGIYPITLAKSPVDGTVWFADGNQTIGRVTAAGVVTTSTLPIDSATQSGMEQLAFDPSGNVWAAQNAQGNVVRVSPSFVVTAYLPPQNLPGTFGTGVRTDGKVWYTGIEGAAYLLDPAAYDAAGLPH